MKKNILIYIMLTLFIMSCKSEKKEENKFAKLKSTKSINRVIEVKSAKVERKDFNMELLTNGKASVAKSAVLKFALKGEIDRVYVKNGDRVKKGDLLAKINTDNLSQEFERASLDLKDKYLALGNEIISRGYKLRDSASIPKKLFDIMKLKSGYSKAFLAYNNAKTNLKKSKIIAPFDGVVSDIKAKPYNNSSEYSEFCVLLDDKSIEISFNILETEILKVKINDNIEAFPFANKNTKFLGKISEINPRVDDKGMVRIKAKIDNCDGKIIDGMNMNVLVRRLLKDKMVVPKSAIIKRQNSDILFVVSNGEAIWKYVKVGEENSDEVIINEGVNIGDEVIISNNIALAHQTKIKVVE